MSNRHLPMPHCEPEHVGVDRYRNPSTLVMPDGSLVCWTGHLFELGVAMWAAVLDAHTAGV